MACSDCAGAVAVAAGAGSVFRHPWAVLFIEPLHGITYAVMWSASASYAHQVAPEGMGA